MTALADLDLATREKKAMECNVGDDDLNKVLKPEAPKKKKEVTRVIESSADDDENKPKRSLGPKIAMVFALLGVAAAGVSVYFTLYRKDTVTVRIATSDISTEIPLSSVRRNGTYMVGVVSDATAWLAKPEAERRKQLEAAVPKVRAQQANGLMLVDAQGLVVAMLKLDRAQQITFPRR